MSLMGKRGMRKVAEITYHRAHYAARRIADLPDYRVLTDQPFFREFVVQCPRPVAEINAALREQGIIGGYDLSNDEPQLGNAMLVAVTEMNTPVEIDRFVAALAAAA
jgi:glycine dehydrogenase subunit 1